MSQPTGRTLARYDADLVQQMPGLVNDGWWRDPLAADEAAGIIAESEFVPDGWRDATALAAKDLIKRGGDARFVAIACPALEDALRTMFATVNDAPEALTARLGAYYATLDGFGQARVPDVILHPLRPSVDPNDPDARRPNAMPSKLPRGVRNALEDLFMRDKGPALRAAYAHGSVALDPDGRFEDVGHRADGVRGADGACARLLLLVILDMCVAVGTLGGIPARGWRGRDRSETRQHCSSHPRRVPRALPPVGAIPCVAGGCRAIHATDHGSLTPIHVHIVIRRGSRRSGRRGVGARV